MNHAKRLIKGMTVEQASKKHGIPKSVLYGRLRRNWDESRILDTPPEGAKIYISGMTFDEIAELTGLAKGAIVSRYRRGWTDEQIINTPSGQARTDEAKRWDDSWSSVAKRMSPAARLFCGVVA
jgi:hypothetical protein